MRCIERCAGFKLQELVARKELSVRDLTVDKELAVEFKRASQSAPSNAKITGQFNARTGDEIVDDLSVTAQSHIEMSNTDSLPVNRSQSRTSKRKKLFSSLDILEDHRSTIDGEDDDHDSLLVDNDIEDKDSDDGLDLDLDTSMSRSKARTTDVLEADFYESMKSKATTSTDGVFSNDAFDEDRNKNLLSTRRSLSKILTT